MAPLYEHHAAYVRCIFTASWIAFCVSPRTLISAQNDVGSFPCDASSASTFRSRRRLVAPRKEYIAKNVTMGMNPKIVQSATFLPFSFANALAMNPSGMVNRMRGSSCASTDG